MIRAIFLDIDDTLLNFSKNADKCAKFAAEQLNVELPSDYMIVFDEINEQLWNRIQDKTLTREELLKIRWKMILEKLNIETDSDSFERLFVEHLVDSAIKEDGADELIEYLASKYELFIASNATQYQQENRIRIAGWENKFKAVITSQLAKHPKPQKEFFDYIFSNVDYDKDEVVMIGDSLSADIIGAKEYGLKTIWYNSKKLDIENNSDWQVNHLLQIKEIL